MHTALSPDAGAVARDIEAQNQPSGASVMNLLVDAARQTGRSPVKIALDYWKLKRARKLKFEEFMLYELYDTEKYSEEERMRFISAYQHWPIIRECVNTSWWALTEDKWLSGNFLESAGLPVPDIVAVIDRSERLFGHTPKLSNASQLRDFLTNSDDMPLFCKNFNSMWSAGAFMIVAADEERVHLKNEGPVTYDDLMEKFVGKNGYVIQKIVSNDCFFAGISSATATVRLINTLTDEGLSTPYAVLKLPRGKNIADNFWRPGNVVCNLDVQSGEVLSIASKNGAKITRHEHLPGSDRTLIGEKLPHWDAVREVNGKAALLHGGICYTSTDIAITRDGPVIVEINTGGAFELPQIASGEGFLRDDVRDFFKSRGCKRF